MASDTKDWFIGERSEALANLMLRSRGDIKIVDESDTDLGADFLLNVDQGDAPWRMPFVVQVKGTASSDYNAWFADAKPELFRQHEKNPAVLPNCLFLFNVRDRRAYYAWISEPLVQPDKSATLRFASNGGLHELDQSAIDEIIARVREWYAAKQFVLKGA